MRENIVMLCEWKDDEVRKRGRKLWVICVVSGENNSDGSRMCFAFVQKFELFHSRVHSMVESDGMEC